jgi:HEAT repeat protein
LGRSIGDADRQVAAAAIAALGQIGTGEAEAALAAAAGGVPMDLRAALGEAWLQCAEALGPGGAMPPAAVDSLRKLTGPEWPPAVRLAAFPRWVATQGDRAAEPVLDALVGTDLVLQGAAIRALNAGEPKGLLRAVADRLETVPAGVQEPVIAILGRRGGVGVLPALERAAARSDPGVRLAAIRALGQAGDRTAVDGLLARVDPASESEQAAVAEALVRLRGDGVEAALVAAFEGGASPARQRVLLGALAGRGSARAGAAGRSALGSADAGVRREALGVVRRFGTAEAVSPLIQRLEGGDAGEGPAVQAALVEIGRREPAALASIAAALAGHTPEVRVALLDVLGATADARALDGIRTQLGAPEAAVRQAAVRALAEWPDAAPFEDLVGIVERGADPRERLVAARGLNRMAPQNPRRAGRAAEALAGALAAADDVAGRRTLMTALAGLPSVASFEALRRLLASAELGAEAVGPLVGVGEAVYPWHEAEVRAGLAEVRARESLPSELAARVVALEAKLGQPANFAIGALATSPDGLEKDGAANGDAAAADGRPETYWDEQDNQKLYVLRLQLREPSTVGCVRILGWKQHEYAPKDFTVLANDRVVKTVVGAQYTDNWLTVEFPPVASEVIELRITGYYGQSPAIREIELYGVRPGS